jgi:hypothetical protein
LRRIRRPTEFRLLPLDQPHIGAEGSSDALQRASHRARLTPLDAADVSLVDAAPLGQLGLCQPVLVAEFHDLGGNVVCVVEDLQLLVRSRGQPGIPAGNDFAEATSHPFTSLASMANCP